MGDATYPSAFEARRDRANAQYAIASHAEVVTSSAMSSERSKAIASRPTQVRGAAQEVQPGYALSRICGLPVREVVDHHDTGQRHPSEKQRFARQSDVDHSSRTEAARQEISQVPSYQSTRAIPSGGQGEVGRSERREYAQADRGDPTQVQTFVSRARSQRWRTQAPLDELDEVQDSRGSLCRAEIRRSHVRPRRRATRER